MKTVYLGLTGDFIHPGIINIISRATAYGEVLVGLLTDAAIVSHKRLPYLDYEQRKQVVENLKGVSRVVPQPEWSYVPNLRRYRPDYIIHGDDWRSGPLCRIREEVFEAMREWHGEVIEIPYTIGLESSRLVEKNRPPGTTPELRLRALRRLLEAKPLVRLLEVHSGLSGLIVENSCVRQEDRMEAFDGMWSSSLTVSASKGKPDIEAVDLTARLLALSDILECTTKPIVFDGDTGGRNEHFAFAVRALERNGISAVIVEDKTGLKRNSLFGNEVTQTLESVENFCDKLYIGKAAQLSEDFMIFARLEALIAGYGVDEALKRACAYTEAGADGIMIHSREKSGEDIREFCRRYRKRYSHVPIVAVPTSYNQITEKELESWGVNIVIYANHMLRASYPAMLATAESILTHGRSLEADRLCMPIRQIIELIPWGKM